MVRLRPTFSLERMRRKKGNKGNNRLLPQEIERSNKFSGYQNYLKDRKQRKQTPQQKPINKDYHILLNNISGGGSAKNKDNIYRNELIKNFEKRNIKKSSISDGYPWRQSSFLR